MLLVLFHENRQVVSRFENLHYATFQLKQSTVMTNVKNNGKGNGKNNDKNNNKIVYFSIIDFFKYNRLASNKENPLYVTGKCSLEVSWCSNMFFTVTCSLRISWCGNMLIISLITWLIVWWRAHYMFHGVVTCSLYVSWCGDVLITCLMMR